MKKTVPQRRGNRFPIQVSNSERTYVRILAARCARALRLFAALDNNKRAQGKPGARCTRGLACNRAQKNAHEHTGSAEAIRLSLRDGLRLITRSPRCPGFLATVIPEKLVSQELDTSVGVSGPRAFAVRHSSIRHAPPSRPPHPTARS
jgi:hypothetical protein